MTVAKREALSYLILFVVIVGSLGVTWYSTKVAAEADLYRNAIAVSSEAIVLVKVRADPHGTVDVWSEGAEKLLGWKARDIEGKSISMVIPEMMIPRHNMKMSAAIRRGGLSGGATVQYVKCNALHKDGRLIPVVTNIRYQESGGIQQFVGILDPQEKVIMVDASE